MGGGGAERVLSDMARYWVKRGHSVTLATWSGPDHPDFYALDPRVERRHLSVPATRANPVSRALSNLARVRRLRATVRRLRPDVVLSFLDWSNVLTILATRGLGTRVAVSERVHPQFHRGLQTQWRFLRARVYRYADCVVAQTRRAADWLDEHCAIRSVVIPNPLRDLPDLALPREPTFVAVGRLTNQKGFDLLIDAFGRVAESLPAWQLKIIGGGPDADALRLLAEQRGIADRVRFEPPVDDVERPMASAGVFVLSSRFEGFPNVLLEAMALGAPVVATDCPAGPAELIRHDDNGLLVPINDAQALANAMHALAEDPQRRQRLGDAARAVRQNYAQDTIMARWNEHLGL